MSKQQRYDVSSKWAVIFGFSVVGIIGGIALTIAGLL